MDEEIEQLNRLYKEQDDIYRAAAVRAGLSDAMFWVLYAVVASPQGYTQNALCSEWFYSKQTVNSAIRALAERGYLELRPLPGRGNRKAIALTPQGEAFCDQHLRPLRRAEAASFAELSAAERRTFLALFRRQVDALRSKMQSL